jgi:16S rRNA pseudouridine516 synthase
MSKLLRIDRILSNFGYCTRSQAREWVKRKRVSVNGVTADDFSAKVDPCDVLIDHVPIDHPAGIYVAFHKPARFICTHDASEGQIVYDLLPPQWPLRDPKVSSIGRLDKDASGLLLLTDDTSLTRRLASPSRHVPKIYAVEVNKTIDASVAERFKAGTIMLKNEKEPCLPAELVLRSPTQCEVTLHEGRYHQIKRMFASCGYEVLKLHRISFGKLTLGDLAEGTWREFDPATL